MCKELVKVNDTLIILPFQKKFPISYRICADVNGSEVIFHIRMKISTRENQDFTCELQKYTCLYVFIHMENLLLHE